ncbi:LysE family transporter [Flavobacterium sp.]|uniref:LysE family transporter n=1 Tax=Flavobacterium sp. TaxID=239 RepID=UPI00260CB2F9|nr:LysE family transporter [Flavobacterium sp.]
MYAALPLLLPAFVAQQIVLPITFGFAAAVIGIIPPGLINMTAARIALDEGRVRAVMFALGATLTVIFQTVIALIFARFIDAHPEVVILLREIGLAIFILLTIYFFSRGTHKPKSAKEVKVRSKKGRFFFGMLLSAINFFPIPFYVIVSVSLSSFGYFDFENSEIGNFVTGSAVGSFMAFYCYISLFSKLESKTAVILKNMNYIIGSVTGLVSIFTIINILEYYFG